jgi:5-methylthioribose kinase
MQLLDAQTTEHYLRRRSELASNESVHVSELSGGVSNEVLLVERGRGDRFVLKQARAQLRTRQEWRCDIRRIWREMEVLRLCGEVLRKSDLNFGTDITATVPDILFEDRENYAYAMTAAPAEHQTWKQPLLSGQVDLAVGIAVGRMLGALHAGTWKNANAAALLDDRGFFQALRIDPYYRRIAEVHPHLQREIEQLIASLDQNRMALVHGDFSPKNLLIFNRQLMLIDFEVGHFGDPAFDNGFCLTHLVLKAIGRDRLEPAYWNLVASFWSAYGDVMCRVAGSTWDDLERRTILHVAGCMLARVDGKSPVDYLSEPQRERVRRIAFELFSSPPQRINDISGLCRQF